MKGIQNDELVLYDGLNVNKKYKWKGRNKKKQYVDDG